MEQASQQTPTAKLRMLDWEADIAGSPGYAEAYGRVCDLFDTHATFRQEALNKAHAVLSTRLGAASIASAAVRECVEYLLKEFAYLLLCREALGRDLVIPYHQDFALAQDFCAGRYRAKLPGVGWLIYEIDVADEAANEKGEINGN